MKYSHTMELAFTVESEGYANELTKEELVEALERRLDLLKSEPDENFVDACSLDHTYPTPPEKKSEPVMKTYKVTARDRYFLDRTVIVHTTSRQGAYLAGEDLLASGNESERVEAGSYEFDETDPYLDVDEVK